MGLTLFAILADAILKSTHNRVMGRQSFKSNLDFPSFHTLTMAITKFSYI